MSPRSRKAKRKKPRLDRTPVSANAKGRPAPEEQPDAPAAPRTAWYKNEWAILALILLVGLCLRVSYLREIVHEPEFTAPTEDPEFMDYWGRAIASGNWQYPANRPDPEIPQSPFQVAPLYAYFLALVYWLTGSSYLAIRIVQMALGLLSAVLAFLVGRLIFGRAVGLITAAFMSLYWAFIYFEGELLPSSLAIFLLILMTYIFCLWAQKPTVLRAFAAGVAMGVFCLARANALLFGPGIVAWIGWVTLRKRDWRRFIVSSAAVTLGAIAAVCPATIRNYRVSGEFCLICFGFGCSLHMGNSEDANGVGTWSSELHELTGYENWSLFALATIKRNLGKRIGLERPMTWAEYDSYLAGLGVDFIKKNPGRVLQLVLKKAYLFWSPVEISSNEVIHYHKAYSPTLRYLPGFALAAALFFLGVMLFLIEELSGKSGTTERARSVAALALVVTAIYYLSFLPFTVNARYRAMIIPLLFLFGAFGVRRIVQFAAARDFRKFGLWSAVAVGLYGVCSIEFIPYEPDLWEYYFQRALTSAEVGEFDEMIEEARTLLELDESARTHTVLGRALSEKGESEEAVEHFERALEIDPQYAYAHNNLGYELAQKGKTDEALSHYYAALESEPDLTLAHNNLGNLLLDLGRYEEAVSHFEHALRVHPYDEHAEYNLARALAEQGKFEQAIAHYVRAADNNPEDPKAPNNLGLAYAALGRSEEAIASYREALRRDPGYPNAHNNLGYEFGKIGKIDAAIEQYEEALKLDPQYGLAHNNLGNVLAEQGKADQAIAHFLKAIQIDPRDKYADYNLANVLASQGKLDKALENYSRALENNPDDPNVPNNLGLALASQGRYDEAIPYYEMALRIDPNYAKAYFNLGNLLAEKGRLDDAVGLLTKALRLDPGFELARENLRKVKNLRDKLRSAGP